MKNVWKEKYWNHVKITVEDTYTKEIFKKSNITSVFSYFIQHIFIGLNSGMATLHSDKLNKSYFIFVYYLGHDFH